MLPILDSVVKRKTFGQREKTLAFSLLLKFLFGSLSPCYLW